MPCAPRVLVVQHEKGTGAGWFGEWLAEAGLSLEVCHPYAGEQVPPFPSYDAVVVLGGAMAPAEDERCPWLPVVRARIVDAVEASVPLFGICLGAQLLSLACGGTVRRGVHGPELGVLDIEVLDQGSSDPLFGQLPPSVPVVQWHWEEITSVPVQAVVLARSALYAHQVFRVGDRAWGVQGHPEVTANIATDWARADSPLLLAAGRSADDLIDEVRDHEPALSAAWRPVAQGFARIVHAQMTPLPAH